MIKMKKETIEKANKLERQIKALKSYLKGDSMFCWRGFAIHFVINFGQSMGKDVYHEISPAFDIEEEWEINDKIKAVLEEALKRKQKELEEL